MHHNLIKLFGYDCCASRLLLSGCLQSNFQGVKLETVIVTADHGKSMCLLHHSMDSRLTMKKKDVECSFNKAKALHEQWFRNCTQKDRSFFIRKVDRWFSVWIKALWNTSKMIMTVIFNREQNLDKKSHQLSIMGSKNRRRAWARLVLLQ